MAAALSSSFPFLIFARFSASAVAVLVVIWALHFKSSFIPQSPSQEEHIYAVMHPLLMVIGFILISGEAILVHKWLPGSRNLKKLVHLCLQGVALACGIFVIWTKFHSQEGIVANFYSLHSWMALFVFLSLGLRVPHNGAVGVWIHELLAQRRGTNNEATGTTMACVPRSLHIWFSSGNS